MLVKSWLGVSKSNLVGGELVIAVHDGVELVVHNLLVEWVKEDLGVLLAIHGNSGGFSSDVRWVDLNRNKINFKFQNFIIAAINCY